MKLAKLDKAKILLLHAEAHCKFGSNADNTIRAPDPADIEAAKIIKELVDRL